MENVLLRFPHLGEAIFQKIDNKSLASCQSVSGLWYRFIQYQKRPKWIRIKHLLVKNLETLSKEFHEVPIFYGSKFNGSFVKLFFSAMHNKTICSGGTFLHVAAMYGCLGICELTIRKIHKVEDRNPSNEWGETPLHYAADHCHLEVCKLIIQSVDEKNPKNNEGDTPLHFAARRGKASICELIMKNIWDKNPGAFGYTPSNEQGETPLHYAAANGRLEVCQLIIQCVDEKNPKNNEGFTPLHFAARQGKASICELIMKNIWDKNPKAFDGSTPLQEAVKANRSHQDHLNVCKVLVENGADENLTDQKGRTPIAYAYYQNNENSPLFQYLLSLL